MKRRTVLGGAGLFLTSGVMSALGAGCFPEPPPAEPDPCNVQIVTLRIYASDLINPNDDDKPRPVMVRLYQLSTDMRMLNARYDDILLRDAEVLGEDLLKRDEVTVFPNDLVEVQFERIPEASVLVGAAMFRTPQGESWKTYYVFPPMPNTPDACKKGGEAEAEEPQAFPETAFFVVERKIDNGSQFDESMFPNARPYKKINLPKRSAAAEDLSGGEPGGGVKGKGP
jgi:type VI secretion system protein VasD